jgi:creatinine amidohydrolase
MIAPALRLLACLLLPWIASTALAQAPASVFLDDLTWTELRDRIHGGATTILVPIGGTEQNGPHMALGKHNVRAKLLAEKIAVALGNALVAPVVAYVPEGGVAPPTSHMRFPGTITVPDAAFEQMLEQAARSFRLHGFRDIVFLCDHGSYQRNVNAAAERLNREWAKTTARAHALPEYYAAASDQYAKLLASKGFPAAEIGTHAGLADTSLTLALDPTLVRTDRLAAAAAAGVSGGAYGDPRRANADVGQLGVDMIVKATVGAIQRAIRR